MCNGIGSYISIKTSNHAKQKSPADPGPGTLYAILV